MNITINCGSQTLEWYPGSFSGGSEEQTIILAGLLGTAHSVTVYGTVKKPIDNFLPTDHFDPPTHSCDVYFGLRNWRLFDRRYAPIQILLCHDIPVEAHWPTESRADALRFIDHVCVLNDYHKDLYLNAGCPSEKIVVVPIVINHNPYLYEVKRNPYRCIWTPHPNRGVHKLRQYWPEIKAQVPQATLQPCWWNEADKDFFLEPNESLGILPTKLLNHEDLSRELAGSEVFPYCSTFDPEISPASCLKAQNSQVIPVVIPKGGMRATLGYKAIYTNEKMFVYHVVEALNHGHIWQPAMEDYLAKHRPPSVLNAWNTIIG